MLFMFSFLLLAIICLKRTAIAIKGHTLTHMPNWEFLSFVHCKTSMFGYCNLQSFMKIRVCIGQLDEELDPTYINELLPLAHTI